MPRKVARLVAQHAARPKYGKDGISKEEVMGAIGSDFIVRMAARRTKCSECGRNIAEGFPEMVSIRKGKVQKRVCSNECRLEFDNRYWQELAASKDRK